jgi:hypothetical protein
MRGITFFKQMFLVSFVICVFMLIIVNRNPNTKYHPQIKHVSHLRIFNKKSLPNALIIGAAKCGTTALIEFLSVHPQVAATQREIDYFSNFENYKKGIEWYREQISIK